MFFLVDAQSNEIETENPVYASTHASAARKLTRQDASLQDHRSHLLSVIEGFGANQFEQQPQQFMVGVRPLDDSERSEHTEKYGLDDKTYAVPLSRYDSNLEQEDGSYVPDAADEDQEDDLYFNGNEADYDEDQGEDDDQGEEEDDGEGEAEGEGEGEGEEEGEGEDDEEEAAAAEYANEYAAAALTQQQAQQGQFYDEGGDSQYADEGEGAGDDDITSSQEAEAAYA
jgi:hypothetical protein